MGGWYSNQLVDYWMNGWMDKHTCCWWVDGWMDGWMDGGLVDGGWVGGATTTHGLPVASLIPRSPHLLCKWRRPWWVPGKRLRTNVAAIMYTDWELTGGTLLRASSPSICSRGIQPSMLIRSIQWASTSWQNEDYTCTYLHGHFVYCVNM